MGRPPPSAASRVAYVRGCWSTSSDQHDRRGGRAGGFDLMDLGSVDVDCPDCGATLKVKVDDIARQRSVRCRNGHQIKLVDEGGGARKAQKAMDDFDKKLRDIGFR